MRIFISLLVLCGGCLAIIFGLRAAPVQKGSYVVKKVLNGDSLLLSFGRKIELVGVVIPEMARKSAPGKAQSFERGMKASEFIAYLIGHEKVEVIPAGNEVIKDQRDYKNKRGYIRAQVLLKTRGQYERYMKYMRERSARAAFEKTSWLNQGQNEEEFISGFKKFNNNDVSIHEFHYGMKTAKVVIDLSKVLVKEGYGYVNHNYETFIRNELQLYQDEAVSQHRGIWANLNEEPLLQKVLEIK